MKQDENKKKKLISFLVPLFLIAVISSSIVCYTLGSKSGSSTTGKIIDTIIIDEPQNTATLPIYLMGKVNCDNKDCGGITFVYNNNEKSSLDKNNIFLLKNIMYGKSSFMVLDANGKVLNKIFLTLNQSTSNEKISVKKVNNGYEINVGNNIVLLELNLNYNEANKELTLNVDKTMVVTANGKLIDNNKTKIIEDESLVTTNGNIVIPEGIIIIPYQGIILANGTFIGNDGTINYPNDVTSLPEGITVNNDGGITLKDKTIIKPDGTIIRPKNTKSSKETTPATDVKEKEKEKESNSLEESEPLTWNNPIVKQGSKSWNQLTMIDLFATNDSSIDGKIYPGVSGSYEFSIENKNPYDIKFSIDMKEKEHIAGNINFEYRLKYYDNASEEYIYVIGDDETYLSNDKLSITNMVTLSANKNISYILEWIWQNGKGKEQDLKDGKIGSSNDKVHYIDMKIYIET